MSATPTARSACSTSGSVVAGNETIQRNLLKLLKSLPVGPESKSAASSEPEVRSTMLEPAGELTG